MIPFCVVGLVDKVQTVVTIWVGRDGSSVTWYHTAVRVHKIELYMPHTERLLYQFGGFPSGWSHSAHRNYK